MKTAIVLGGTVPHIDLICQLKNRGYRTVLVDYSIAPPAKEYADEHISESTLDKEAVLQIARDKNADLVISTSVDQANVVCCYVAEKLGLPHPYSYDTALNVTDKVRMKSIMLEHGIETSRHFSLERSDELITKDLRYPIMIKPADSNSAKGVKKAETAEEAVIAFDAAKQYSRNGMVIAEEYVEGIEISAYGYISNHQPTVIMIQERISTYDGADKVIKCYASVAPARISEKAKEKARELLKNIADAFELDNTPLFFQGIVKGDDISVIEFAPRTGGGISTQTMKIAAGFDFISAAIDSYIGLTPDFSKLHPLKRIYAVNQVYAETGMIGAITGWEDLQSSGLVD
ncbi:MAG: ATP-grasp domain-containing protein, partial [Clostridia bacterium]|nr:ATP-grasp domain-containing protein [Clostridia bacterium]